MSKENARGMQDDVISRQAAIDAVQNRHMMLSKEKVMLINDLEKLPSALGTNLASLGTDAISRQVLDLWNRYRPTIAVDAIEYDMELRRLLSTNLAEVGTRQAAIDALKQQADTMSRWSERYAEQRKGVLTAVNIVEDLPPIQTDIVRCEECKYHYQRNCPIEKYFSLDGFCSRGDRGTT